MKGWSSRTSSKGTYYKDPNLEVLITNYNVDIDEEDMVKLICKRSVFYKALHKVSDGSSTMVVKEKLLKMERITLLIFPWPIKSLMPC